LFLNYNSIPDYRLKKAGDGDTAHAVMQLLDSKIPLCFRFLSHSDDDVSAAVMELAREYIIVSGSIVITMQKTGPG